MYTELEKKPNLNFFLKTPCLGGDEAGGVVVAIFPDLDSTRVGTFVHLQFDTASHLWEFICSDEENMQKKTHIKGGDADLDGISIIDPDHPLTLVVVKGIKGSRISEDMPTTPVVSRSIAVVPCLLYTSDAADE